MPNRPFTAGHNLMGTRDARRAAGWLERLGVALMRGDAAGYDCARRALKDMGLNITREPKREQEKAAG